MMNLANLQKMCKKDKLGTFFNHSSQNSWAFLRFDHDSPLQLKRDALNWSDMFLVIGEEEGKMLTI